jgi:hypothetical protein
MSALFKMHVAIDARLGNHLWMDWPHGPAHWLFEPGLYMVTAGTYQKLPHLNSPLRLDFFLSSLFDSASEFDWDLRAWAVFPNHYHFLAASLTPPNLRKFLGKLHMKRPSNLIFGTIRREEKCGSNFGTVTSHLNART